MIEFISSPAKNIICIKMSGTLHDDDYKFFVPIVEEAVNDFGKIKMLVQFEDFHGWDAHALWDDVKFATKHCSHIEKIAMVGEKSWQKWMTLICKPFTLASVTYFDKDEIEEAINWISE